MEIRRQLRNQKGFTLVEIIAVLIILGILAAVAVPKYMDLTTDARNSAAQGAIAEMKGRLTTGYGKYLLANSGTAPADAGTILTTYATELGIGVGGAVTMGADFTLTVTATGNTVTIVVNTVQGQSVNVTGTWVLPT